MANLERIEKIYDILEKYSGSNPYMIYLKNGVFAYKNLTLNEFQMEFIENNYNFEPKYIHKLVKITEWYGVKRQEKLNLDFVPNAMVITWYLGEAKNMYVFYAKYRRSQEGDILTFAPKSGILTDFLVDDFKEREIDFGKFNSNKSGRILKNYQEEGVKFLVSRKKCILADGMGLGKTSQSIVAALESGYKHVLIISPASVKETWRKELSIYVPEDEITIVSGSEWKDNKFTIINYDILDNFYEVPTETYNFKENDVDENGKIIKKTVSRTMVSRKKSVIDAAMKNSQLFKSHFDLIIIDEAHRLSNKSAGRYKIVLDLIGRSNPSGIYAITGTPITNNPYNFYNILKLINAPIVKDWEFYVKQYCDGKKIFRKGEKDKWTPIFLKKVGKKAWKDLSRDEKNKLDKFLDENASSLWLHNGATNLDELKERVKGYYLRREKSDFDAMVKKEVKLVHYELTEDENREYNDVWKEYELAKSSEISGKTIEEIEEHKQITEGIVLKQWLSDKMISRTVNLAKKHISNGEKVIIMCSFDNEIKKLKEEFGDSCVVYNGKMTAKKKEKSQSEFMNDDSKKVFIGNIISAGVGITLTSANICIFNSFSFVPGDNLQAQDRIHRLNQTKDCIVYYQVFSNTYYEDIFNTVMSKKEVIDNIIIKEKNK